MLEIRRETPKSDPCFDVGDNPAEFVRRRRLVVLQWYKVEEERASLRRRRCMLAFRF